MALVTARHLKGTSSRNFLSRGTTDCDSGYGYFGLWLVLELALGSVFVNNSFAHPFVSGLFSRCLALAIALTK